MALLLQLASHHTAATEKAGPWQQAQKPWSSMHVVTVHTPLPKGSGLAPALYDWKRRTKDGNENSVEIDPDNKSKNH
jgi:hypothetical protein